MFKILTLALAAILLALSGVAYGAAPAELRLLDLEQAWMRAAQQRDIPALKRILSNDYVDINYRGILRHKADALRASNIQTSNYTQKLRQEKVRLYGKTAVVTGCDVLVAGKQSYFARYTDVFVEKNGVWRAVSSQETEATRCGGVLGKTISASDDPESRHAS